MRRVPPEEYTRRYAIDIYSPVTANRSSFHVFETVSFVPANLYRERIESTLSKHEFRLGAVYHFTFTCVWPQVYVSPSRESRAFLTERIRQNLHRKHAGITARLFHLARPYRSLRSSEKWRMISARPGRPGDNVSSPRRPLPIIHTHNAFVALDQLRRCVSALRTVTL